jgi:hypothetical protein
MNPIFPTPPHQYSASFMSRVIDAVQQSVRFTVNTNTAIDSMMLRSPGGKVYRVSVDDAGALTTTYIAG